MLSNIRIVLVRTFHSGNIGSTARAMKTMGLTNLYLVDPKDFKTKEGKVEALKMSMSADDVVEQATIVDSLYDAVKDCTVVVASTARSRGYDLPVLLPEESAVKLRDHSEKGKVALVFGPERMGLHNDDLQFAKYRVTIPTSPDYSSLNLAAAVQTLSYEIFKAHLSETSSASDDLNPMPDMESLEQFYQHLESSLTQSGFIFKNHPGKVMLKLRRLFTKAEPDTIELKILRGMLASFQSDKNPKK